MKMIKVMSKKLVRKAIEMIKALAEEDEEDDEEEYDEDSKDDDSKDKKDDEEGKDKDEDSTDKKKKDGEEEDEEAEEEKSMKYPNFWKHFGKNIKLGIIEDASNRNKLAKLLRFQSTHDPDGLTSLDEYISRMK